MIQARLNYLISDTKQEQLDPLIYLQLRITLFVKVNIECMFLVNSNI